MQRSLGEKRLSSQKWAAPRGPGAAYRNLHVRLCRRTEAHSVPDPFLIVCVFMWVSEEQWEPSVWRRCEVLDGVTEYESVCVCVCMTQRATGLCLWQQPLVLHEECFPCAHWRKTERERLWMDAMEKLKEHRLYLIPVTEQQRDNRTEIGMSCERASHKNDY